MIDGFFSDMLFGVCINISFKSDEPCMVLSQCLKYFNKFLMIRWILNDVACFSEHIAEAVV